MAYIEGTASGYLDLLSGLVALLTADNGSGEPEFGAANTGDGTITKPTGDSAAPTETWTLTCTMAGGDATATFSVVGSVTGSDGTATSGSAYSGTVLFTISAGGTDWEVGDTISFELSKLGWSVLKDTTSSFTTDGEVYLQGVGLAGTEEIHVNLQAKSDVGNDKYYWILQGASDFDTGLSFNGQLGAIPTGQGPPLIWLDSGSIDYAIAANAQRFIVLAQVGGSQQICYCGFLHRLAQPGIYPYPLFIGGTHFDEADSIADNADQHTFFLRDYIGTQNTKSGAHLYLPGATWARLRAYATNGVGMDKSEATLIVYPNGTQNVAATSFGVVPAPSGKYPVVDSVALVHNSVYDSSETGITDRLFGDLSPVGVFDGMAWTTGFNLTSDDLINNKRWRAVQNTFRNGRLDFAAMRRA